MLVFQGVCEAKPGGWLRRNHQLQFGSSNLSLWVGLSSIYEDMNIHLTILCVPLFWIACIDTVIEKYMAQSLHIDPLLTYLLVSASHLL